MTKYATTRDCPARWHDYSDYTNGHCVRGCFYGRLAMSSYRKGLRERKNAGTYRDGRRRAAGESPARPTLAG